MQDRGRDELLLGTNVVDFVCRNISLWKDDEQELPLNPYMTLQLGRGWIEARALVTACILRQLGIESLIVQAAPTAKDANDKWLLGIPYNGKIYLFDLKLGLPVSGSTEAVASLADIIAQPDLLNQLTAAGSYRITADELKAAEIQVIADATFWSRRMWNVEQDLPASDSCVLYQPPIRTDDQPGLLQLVATKSGIAFDQLKLWPYPHRIQADAQVPSEAKGIQFQRLSAPFAVPIPFKSAGEGKPVEFGLPERKLERFRSAHLMGQFTEASQRYLSIRHLEVERNPPELDRLNRVAAEDAFYWTALCKVELNDHAAAIDLLSGYLKKYDRKGSWYFSARTQLARSQAIAGHTSDAIKTLERSSSDDPYQDLNALLVKRWKASEK